MQTVGVKTLLLSSYWAVVRGFEKTSSSGVRSLLTLSQATMYEMVRSVKLWHTRQKTTTTIKEHAL